VEEIGFWRMTEQTIQGQSEKGAEPQSGTTNCLKRQDALPAFIRK